MLTMLADHLWQSTLVAMFLGSLTLPLRRHSARLRYRLWLCASVKFLVPFAPLLALGRLLGARAAPVTADGGGWGADLAQLVQPEALERFAQPTEALRRAASAASSAIASPTMALADAVPVLLSVWVAGTIAVLALWFAQWLALTALVRRSRPLSVPLLDGTLPVRVGPTRIEPGIVGIAHPVLLLPEGIIERLTPAQLRAVVEHELCHVRRRDNLSAATHMLVEALFWFHPFVWWIGARLVDERERACDESVLAATGDPRSYAAAILQVCEVYVRAPLTCVAGIGSGGRLPARIERLLSSPSVRALGPLGRAALAASATALLGAPIVVGLLNAPPARAQNAAASTAELEDVSITAGPGTLGFRFNGESMTVTDQPLALLIATAFDLQRPQIVGPGDLDARRSYSYSVSAASGGPVGEARFQALNRALLELRFNFAYHRETTVIPALALMRGGAGTGIAPASARELSRTEVHPGSASFTNFQMHDVTKVLAQYVGVPIVDRTDLTERYTFSVTWPNQHPSRDDVLHALEEQLGLTLVAVDAPIERLIVDRIEMPNELASNAALVVEPPARLVLTLDATGVMSLKRGDTTTGGLDARSVADIAAAALAENPALAVVVKADGSVAYARVVEAVNLLSRSGATRIDFETR